MLRIGQCVCGIALIALAGFGGWMANHSTPVAAAEASPSVDWKAILSEADLVKMVEDCVDELKEATKSPSQLNLKSSTAQNKAYCLVLLGHAGKNLGNAELAAKSAALQDAAQKLAQAAKKKNHDEAKALVDVIAGFKTMKADGAAGADINIKEAIPIHNLMEEVQDVNKNFIKYRRLRGAAFTAGTKPAEIELDSRKMAVLTVAISAHAPEADTKMWLDSSAEVRKECIEMAGLAKAKDGDEWKKAFRRMDSACTECHDVFRE